MGTPEGAGLPDVIAPDLRVLFCGINPSLYSAAVGHHFARPGNRFWKTLHRAGFTDRLLSPFEDRLLLDHGLGLTNLAARPTAGAADLSDGELRAGGRLLEEKVRRFHPGAVAILGVGSYRVAFGERKAAVGPSARGLGARPLWILPNPSGLNAHYQLDALVEAYLALASAVGG